MKSSKVTNDIELITEDMVLSEALKIPATQSPGNPSRCPKSLIMKRGISWNILTVQILN